MPPLSLSPSQFMIGCDECESWYHGPCVGVGKQQADSMDDYLCPHCAAAAGKPYAFGPPQPVPRLTRRPKLKYVSALLAEADEIGVETEEAELIRAIEARASEWQAQARSLLDAKDADDDYLFFDLLSGFVLWGSTAPLKLPLKLGQLGS